MTFSDPVDSGCWWIDPNLAELLCSTYVLISVFRDHSEVPKESPSSKKLQTFPWDTDKKGCLTIYFMCIILNCWGQEMPVRNWFISNIHYCIILVMLKRSRCYVKAHLTNSPTIGLGHSSRNLQRTNCVLFMCGATA